MTGKITINIIDDHQLIRQMWVNIFSEKPALEVTGSCGSFEQIEDMIKTKRPNIVLLDINLGDKSGIDAVPLIRKISPGSKIIVVSMRSEPVYAKKMLKLGVKAYITKNSSQEEFFKAIAEVIAGQTYICSEISSKLAMETLLNEDTEHDLSQLSMREIEILKFIKAGLASREIADHLFISVRTVDAHRQNILKKLNFKNTASLINFINNTDFNFI